MRCGRLFLYAASVAVLLTACTSDGDSDTTIAPPLTLIASTTTTTEPPLDFQAHAAERMVGIQSEGEFLNFDSPGIADVGEGSGLVVSSDGLILTTATAVVGAERINVFVPGEQFPLVGELDAAAECVNLALVRVDHEFAQPVSFDGTGTPVAVASVDEGVVSVAEIDPAPSGDFYTFRPRATTGSVLFDEDGGATGVVLGFDDSGATMALRNGATGMWVRQMREREIVQQLGFTATQNTEGQLVVVSLADSGPGTELSLELGDIIIGAEGDDLVGGLDQLCGALEDGAAALEVQKDGRLYIGAIPDEELTLASARSTDEIRQAVVDVQTEFGGGSGFFISEDGYAVTNYHVAGQYEEVQLRFDAADDTVPARVVGASACADIAVLKAEGTFEYLEWAPVAPVLEEELRVVGFPNFTETISFQDGAVTKEVAEGAPWGGFFTNFESSAKTDGGNSGGPVVNSDGEILGVHYASQGGNSDAIVNALHLVGVEVRQTVDEIIDGTLLDPGFQPDWTPVGNFDGVTGRALMVLHPRPASAATALGLEWGDQIVFLGGVGPQQGYGGYELVCDSIAENEARSPMDVVVYRSWSDSLWDGQFYGSPLAERPDPYRLGDGTGTISAIVPGRWVEHDDINEEDNDYVGYWAAPDLSEYFGTFSGVHGMRLAWSLDRAETHTTVQHLESVGYSDQASGPVVEYNEDGFVGHYQSYVWSTGVGREYALRIAGDPDSPLIILFLADAPHLLDSTATRMLESLQVDVPVAEE